MGVVGGAAMLLVTVGCSDGSLTSSAADSGARDGEVAANGSLGEPTLEPTFSAIYREVFPAGRCTLGLCHGEGASGGGLELFPKEAAYANLVGVRSTSPSCAELGLALVVPESPDDSLLFLKLDREPPCGDPMPPHQSLDPAEMDQVARWIELGAHDD